MAKTRKFVVRKGHSIFMGGSGVNVKKFRGGEVVSLTAKEAKHFHKSGHLDPYLEEDFEDAEETETDEKAEA